MNTKHKMRVISGETRGHEVIVNVTVRYSAWIPIRISS